MVLRASFFLRKYGADSRHTHTLNSYASPMDGGCPT